MYLIKKTKNSHFTIPKHKQVKSINSHEIGPFFLHVAQVDFTTTQTIVYMEHLVCYFQSTTVKGKFYFLIRNTSCDLKIIMYHDYILSFQTYIAAAFETRIKQFVVSSTCVLCPPKKKKLACCDILVLNVLGF